MDGAIEAEGQGGDASGYIVTDKEYANFDLKWEWKISKGGNSGKNTFEFHDFFLSSLCRCDYETSLAFAALLYYNKYKMSVARATF